MIALAYQYSSWYFQKDFFEKGILEKVIWSMKNNYIILNNTTNNGN